MKGTLYGIGAGPGDPELVTRKAWRIVGEAPVVAYPSAAGTDGKESKSFARSIMTDAINPDAIEIEMPVPMVSGREPAQSIYDKGAAEIEGHLDSGRDVVVLCEGDPLFYGSFMYLLSRLRDRYETKVVPGVTSMTACAAAHNKALVARSDSLMVIPATLEDEAVRERLKQAETVVIMKLGRHLPRIRALLEEEVLTGRALYVSHASLPHQHAVSLSEAPDEAPYFSMIILYRGDDPWI